MSIWRRWSMEDEFLTKQQLSELLQITVRTIDRLRDEGLPYYKIGKSVRFNKQEVLNWIKDQENKK